MSDSDDETTLNQMLNFDTISRFFGEEFILEPELGPGQTPEQIKIYRLVNLVKNIFGKLQGEKAKNKKLQRLSSRLAKKLVGLDQLTEPEMCAVLECGVTLYTQIPFRPSLANEPDEITGVIEDILNAPTEESTCAGSSVPGPESESTFTSPNVEIPLGLTETSKIHDPVSIPRCCSKHFPQEENSSAQSGYVASAIKENPNLSHLTGKSSIRFRRNERLRMCIINYKS